MHHDAPTLSNPKAKARYLAPLLALTLACFSGCKDVTDPADDNEIELFTTVRLDLTNASSPSDKPSATIRFKEGFGHGDALEKNDTLRLKANSAYAAVLSLLNESVNPAEDMGAEVEEEGDAHQLFYAVASAKLTVDYADKDKNDLPIGLKTTFTARETGKGTLTVTLKHQPGLKSKTSTVATGETDVEVTFHVVVE